MRADWRFMLAHGVGVGLRPPGAPVVASAVALPLDGIGWISMVLVTQAWRRRGAARWLVRECIDALAQRGCTPMLDATAAGQPLYAALGFLPGPRFQRWRRPETNVSSSPTLATVTQTQITPIDRAAFGADRSPMLAELLRRCPQAALIATNVSGYALARDGREATQLGPIVARDAQTASALLRAQCVSLPGPLIIDAFDDPGFDATLRDLGFTPHRHFTRMALNTAPLRHPTVFAPAGPELG